MPYIAQLVRRRYQSPDERRQSFNMKFLVNRKRKLSHPGTDDSRTTIDDDVDDDNNDNDESRNTVTLNVDSGLRDRRSRSRNGNGIKSMNDSRGRRTSRNYGHERNESGSREASALGRASCVERIEAYASS